MLFSLIVVNAMLFTICFSHRKCGDEVSTAGYSSWTCLFHDDFEMCCDTAANYTFAKTKDDCPNGEKVENSKSNSNSNSNSDIVCCKSRKCTDWIETKIFRKDDGGSYFLKNNTKNDNIVSLTFMADLLSVDDLSYGGILRLTLKVAVTWKSDVGWSDCEEWNTNGCSMFVERTRHLESFVTDPSKTKFYNFYLKNDTESTLLSKKMNGYPLKVKRDGTNEWVGIIHVALKCALNVRSFPYDKQTCPMEWEMTPKLRNVRVDFKVGDMEKDEENGSSKKRPTTTGLESAAPNSEWNLKSFTCDKRGVFNLFLVRIPTKALTTLTVPVICFNLLVNLVYLLPTSSGERVGYTITLVLSFSVLIMTIDSLIPPSSETTLMGKMRICQSR